MPWPYRLARWSSTARWGLPTPSSRAASRLRASTSGSEAPGPRACRCDDIGESLTPFPFALVFPQDAHERLLIERLDALGVKVERRTELVRFDQHAESVRAVLKRPDGSEEICEAAYLAGCDGAHSTVREALAIGFPGGTYAGLFYVADVEASGPATDRRTARRSRRGRLSGRLSHEGKGVRAPGRNRASKNREAETVS